MKASFQSITAVLAIWALCMSSVACTPQQGLAVAQDIQKFTPAVLNVADAICAFTPAAGICATASTAVSASAAILETALTNYYTALAQGTVPPSILQDLATAISTFEGDASNILNAVHVVDTTHQQEVEAVAASASVLLAVVESLLPNTSTPSATAAKVFAASLPAGGAKKFSLNSWAGSYNAKVAILEGAMPRNAKKLARVHIHNAAFRVASFGILK